MKTFAVSVSAKQFARDVYLHFAGPGAVGTDGFFDDNYLDLLPGETVTVSFHPAAGGAGPSLQALRASLRAMSVADSY